MIVFVINPPDFAQNADKTKRPMMLALVLEHLPDNTQACSSLSSAWQTSMKCSATWRPPYGRGEGGWVFNSWWAFSKARVPPEHRRSLAYAEKVQAGGWRASRCLRINAGRPMPALFIRAVFWYGCLNTPPPRIAFSPKLFLREFFSLFISVSLSGLDDRATLIVCVSQHATGCVCVDCGVMQWIRKV